MYTNYELYVLIEALKDGCHGLNAMSQGINGLYSKEVLLKRKEELLYREDKIYCRGSLRIGHRTTRASCACT